MIEQAYVSGQLGKAIFMEGGHYFLIDTSRSEPVECRPIDLSSFFAFGAQVITLDTDRRIDRASLSKTLEFQEQLHSALRLSISGLDSDLDSDLRLDVIIEAERLLVDVETHRFVRARMLGVPINEAADITTALELATGNECSIIVNIYQSIIESNFAIQIIRPVWDEVASEFFASNEDIDQATREMIDSSIFADLSVRSSKGETEALNALVVNYSRTLKLPGIQRPIALLLNEFKTRVVKAVDKATGARKRSSREPEHDRDEFEVDNTSIDEVLPGFRNRHENPRSRVFKADEAKKKVDHEIDRQVNSLRRQAARARRYEVLREELRELLRQVYVAEDRKLTAVLDETTTKLAEIAELELSIAEELRKREEEAKAAAHEARRFEDQLTTARALAADAVLQRDRQARECVYQQEQLSGLEKRKSEVTSEIDALTERLLLIESECRRLQSEDARLQEEAEETALSLRTAEESYTGKINSAAAAEAELESARSELLSQTAMAERLREIARQLEGTIERLSQQAEGLAREGERAATQHTERRLEAEQFSAELGDARERVTRLQTERETAVDAVVRGYEAASDADAELTRVRDEYSRASHRLESLKELDQRRAYYSPAVQLVFAESGTPRDFHFIGTLADALNVDAKWERAVEGVLGSSLQSIVVPTPGDAVRAAQWLRENNGGRASFLVAGLHGGSEELDHEEEVDHEFETLSPSLVDNVPDDLRISDLLGAPQQLITVLKRTMPHKVNARLATNIEDAMTRSIASDETYVTLNGDWISSGQFVNAGDARAVEEGAGLLAFKRELRELELRAETLSREVEVANVTWTNARARLVRLEDTVVILNEAIGREEREAMIRELTATNLEQEVERSESHLRVVAQDAARVETERVELDERRSHALREAEAAESAREALADNVTKASSLLIGLRRDLEIESKSLAGQRAAAAAAAERRRATTAELRRVESELADFAARVERHRFELAEINGRIDELQISIADLQEKANSVESDREREELEIAELSNKLQEARQRADAFSEQLSELNRRAAEVRDSRAALDVQKAESQARQTFVHENCQTELNQSLEDLAQEVTLAEDFDFDTSHQRVEDLRTRLEGFRGINMMGAGRIG